MSERDYLGILLLITGCAVAGILQSRLIRDLDERLARLTEQVEFLKIVSHETETS